MSSRYNTLVLTPDGLEKGENLEELLGKQLAILAKMGYICTVERECEFYVIHYNYKDQSYGNPYPYWITEDEFFSIPTDEEEDDDSDEG